MQEIWKDIEGYEGEYQVSNFGNVRSLNFMRRGVTRELAKKHSGGYSYVILYKKTKIKRKRIHRLVAETFIPNPDNLPEVNHKDENKENNRIDNLEWCTHQYNFRYTYDRHPEHKERIIQEGIKTAKRKQRVVQKDLQGNIVAVYRGVHAACQATRSGYYCLLSRLENQNKTKIPYRGFLWEYEKEEKP